MYKHVHMRTCTRIYVYPVNIAGYMNSSFFIVFVFFFSILVCLKVFYLIIILFVVITYLIHGIFVHLFFFLQKIKWLLSTIWPDEGYSR